MPIEPPDYHDYPKLLTPTAGGVATAIGTVLGVVVFLRPETGSWELSTRIGVAIGVAIVPFALWGVSHLWRCTLVRTERLRDYDALHEAHRQASESLQQATDTISLLMRERQEVRTLRINYCYTYDSKVLMSLRRKAGFKPEVGSAVIVLGRNDGQVYGHFRITEDNGESYTATAQGNIDPLWKGYIVQNGAGRSEAPPESIAVVPRIEDQEDE
ncbi:hypothetical protein GC176_11635 [bacterium]|nr:hypothetical protein [bacterium]